MRTTPVLLAAVFTLALSNGSQHAGLWRSTQYDQKSDSVAASNAAVSSEAEHDISRAELHLGDRGSEGISDAIDSGRPGAADLVSEPAQDSDPLGEGDRLSGSREVASDNNPVGQGESTVDARYFSSSAGVHQDEDFVIELDSGRTLDLRAVFTKKGQEFERRLRRLSGHRNAFRTRYDDGNLFLFVLHKGTSLHGPTAGFYRGGLPMIYLNYAGGRRAGTLFTWDERGRPWVFAQYKSGRKHGLSAVFRACGEKCTLGHVWLVQEWRRGKLQQSHLVGEGAMPRTLLPEADLDYPENDDYRIASDHFVKFEEQLTKNEKELRTAVARYDHEEDRAAGGVIGQGGAVGQSWSEGFHRWAITCPTPRKVLTALANWAGRPNSCQSIRCRQQRGEGPGREGELSLHGSRKRSSPMGERCVYRSGKGR